MRNVTLIGMPGCGKSTIGGAVAKTLRCHYVDTDRVMIETYHKTLMELIEIYKPEGFLALEEKTIQSIHTNDAIISTGGSAVYGDDAMAYLKSTGIVIYLFCAVSELEKRVGDLVTRGVVCREPCTTLQELYAQRRPLYEKYADMTIDCTSASFEKCCRLLQDAVEKEWKNNTEPAKGGEYLGDSE